PLDAAKGIALMATHGGKIQDYDAAVRGWEKVKPTIPPLIAIPTTAGTGSEMSAAAIITDTSRNVKMIVASPFLKPRVAILDPELTLAMPPSLTAATGMDALTHAVEAYVAADYHPFGDALAIGAVELIGKSLRRAYANGQDVAARTDMLLASAMAGAAMGYKGLGASHALAHQLTPEAGIPHGIANAILLPHVMRFNLPVAAAKFARVAASLGADTHGKDQAQAAEMALEGVTRLCGDLGLPKTLTQAGAKRESIERMAQNALHDRCRKNNPRPCIKADLVELLTQAF
ncbi:MAG: iron-containing alcohol dehydrogenase, partial [Planctomycetes bacterium]|nr:iron-containing alcohol dehydrogenase [Planctomycetota bacterium]